MNDCARFHQGQLTVSEVMSQTPAIVEQGTQLSEVARILSDSRFRHCFVSDSRGRVVGVVASNDLLRQMAEFGDDPGKWQTRTVDTLMTTRFVTSTPDACADDVAPMIGRGRIDCVPVMEGDRLVGVLTPDDLLVSWNRLDPALQQAASDAVTELPNRATFDRRLDEEWQRAYRQRTSLGLLIIDVDYFKQVNDTCGHLAGDAVLHMIGTCLRRQLRSYDVVARFAGDEFVALCVGCAPADVEVPIRRLQNAVQKLSYPSHAGRRSITLSIGAAVICRGFENYTPARLLEAADGCLYRSKREGRNRAYRVEAGPDCDHNEATLVEQLPAISEWMQPAAAPVESAAV